MPAEPLAKTPKELAAQLAEVKQEIAKRQSDAIEISRMLRQLQREEADLYTRAAQIQRQLLNCTNESQPYDLTVLPDVASVEKIVSLQERKATFPASGEAAGR
jgi:chromosome segregation ATPase